VPPGRNTVSIAAEEGGGTPPHPPPATLTGITDGHQLQDYVH